MTKMRSQSLWLGIQQAWMNESISNMISFAYQLVPWYIIPDFSRFQRRTLIISAPRATCRTSNPVLLQNLWLFVQWPSSAWRRLILLLRRCTQTSRTRHEPPILRWLYQDSSRDWYPRLRYEVAPACISDHYDAMASKRSCWLFLVPVNVCYIASCVVRAYIYDTCINDNTQLYVLSICMK